MSLRRAPPAFPDLEMHDLHEHTLVQLLDVIRRDVAEALTAVQALVASAPFCDPALARTELDLIHAATAVERAQQLLRHSVQVLSGLRLPGAETGGPA
jgi:hypothetical protein